jgi:hypothetical protein
MTSLLFLPVLVVVTSDDLRVPLERISTIANGVRHVRVPHTTFRDELGLAPGDRLLVSVGNLYPVKGHREPVIRGDTVLVPVEHKENDAGPEYRVDFTARNTDGLECNGSVRVPTFFRTPHAHR